MMKRIINVFIFVVFAAILSGCMRFTTSVKVKTNGKADVSMLYAISKDLAEMSDQGVDMSLSEDELAKMEEKGWTFSEYNDDDYVGYQLVKKNVDLVKLAESFGDSDQESSINPDQLQIQKNGFKYIIDWKMFEEDQLTQMTEYKAYFNMSGGYMEFVLELPVKASASNATSVSEDGKTLKWDLLSMPAEGIHAEFSLLNMPLIIGCLVAIVVALIVIVVVIIILIGEKKKKAYAQQNMGYAGMTTTGQNNFVNTNSMPTPQQVQAEVPVPQVQSEVPVAQLEQPIVQPEVPVTQAEKPVNQPETPAEQPQITTAQPEQSVEQPKITSVADEILKLKGLMEARVITSEEFEAQKKKLLGD